MSATQELHEAVERLLAFLEAELVRVARSRDALSFQVLEIEQRIAEVSALEQRVRRMP